MQETEIWNRVTNHLMETENAKQQEQFLAWLNESEENKVFFEHVKNIWDRKPVVSSSEQTVSQTFWGRFTKQKIKNFIFNQTIGNLVGFILGMWITAAFSHETLERKSVRNLFGLAGRRKVEVNTIPEWLQNTLAILVGFITLELINHFFQTKKYLVIWNFFKGKTELKK